jgi:DNA-binding CsgD family transcriptional regulator
VLVHGRERERAVIAALLEEAWSSRGGALVVRGEPGVGKSALLADGADTAQARGMQVLRTQGIESESPLAFAALQRILRPAMRYADRLPVPQAHALRVAFGEEADAGTTGNNERFLVFLGTLGVLAEAAEEAPVLAVVDDAHWLDEASAAALLFVARRLRAERVAMLFGAREGDLLGLESGDLPELRVAGIDRDAAAKLLGDRVGTPVPVEVADRLLRNTGGNPLALVELPDVLSGEQLSGQVALPPYLPVTASVERVFLDRCRRLPDEAQTFLLVAAADDSARLPVVRQAAAALGAGADALDTAERSGLVSVLDGEVVLRHPLVRSAVYGGATTLQRRRAHEALAEALGGEQDSDRRTWHRAAAADEPDEVVVAELADSARRAERRGGLEAASSAWERAAELTAAVGARGSRLYEAARTAWLAGQTTRARMLAEAAITEVDTAEVRADAVTLRARVEWNTGSVQLAHRMLLRGAQEVAPVDPQRAREMALIAAALASFGADSGVPIDPATLAPAPDPSDPARAHCFHHLLVGMDLVTRVGIGAAATELRTARDLADQLHPDDHILLPNLAIAALHMGDDPTAHALHTRLLTSSRDSGAVVMTLYALTRVCFTEIATGQWNTAEANAHEAVELAEGTGQPGLTGLPHAWLLLLAALRGTDDFDDHLQATQRVTQAGPMGILDSLSRDVTRWAQGLRASARPASSFHHLAQMTNDTLKRMAALDRIETAVRADQREAAQLWTDDMEQVASATGQQWATAIVEHARALLSEGSASGKHFTAALAAHDHSPRRFDEARTQLAYGEFLRRSRRRVDAREQLRAALNTFEDLRATPWAQRAEQELRASGETARRRDPTAPVVLTPQELQVARLVGQGMSNRDVAAQLYVSPRTIDFHLRNVFTKVGVSSRAELARFATN